MDYRHHWHDVFIGSLLGTFCSYFSYRQYYPHLGSDEAHLPFSPRIEDDDLLPSHHSRLSSDQGHGHEYPHALETGSEPSGSLTPPRIMRRYTDVPTEYELDGTLGRTGQPQRKDTHQVWRDGEFAARPEEAPEAPNGHGIMP